MEFHHRKELSKPTFNLDLSHAELCDFVKADILRPYEKLIDPNTCDTYYEPLFPGPIRKKYKRHRNLLQLIDKDQEFIDKSEDQQWEEFQLHNSNKLEDKDGNELVSQKENYLAHIREVKEVAKQSLEANKKEAAMLDEELKNIPKLYEDYRKNLTSVSEWEDFVKKFDDSYFRRDQIKGVIEAEFKASPDYSSASYKGKEYWFAYKQRQAMSILHQAHLDGVPGLGQACVLEEINSDAKRLRDIFKGNMEAWNDLIEPGERKGTVRLKI